MFNCFDNHLPAESKARMEKAVWDRPVWPLYYRGHRRGLFPHFDPSQLACQPELEGNPLQPGQDQSIAVLFPFHYTPSIFSSLAAG